MVAGCEKRAVEAEDERCKRAGKLPEGLTGKWVRGSEKKHWLCGVVNCVGGVMFQGM